MKIIKKGKPKRDVFVGTCHGCGTVIECERTELKNIQHDQREGGELAQVNCPTCHKQMWVYQN